MRTLALVHGLFGDHRAVHRVGFGASSTLPGHTTTNHSYLFILVYSIVSHVGYQGGYAISVDLLLAN
jgi:hypothetical protein